MDVIPARYEGAIGLYCNRGESRGWRKVFNKKPAEFDFCKYLGPAREEMEKLYKHKIIAVLGSEGKAE